jgi:hypothetical protein
MWRREQNPAQSRGGSAAFTAARKQRGVYGGARAHRRRAARREARRRAQHPSTSEAPKPAWCTGYHDDFRMMRLEHAADAGVGGDAARRRGLGETSA